MTQATTKKITATAGESRIDILIMQAGKEYYATCNYPARRTVKAHGNPYAPGMTMLPARTTNEPTTEKALEGMLDLLEKKMGMRPVVGAK